MTAYSSLLTLSLIDSLILAYYSILSILVATSLCSLTLAAVDDSLASAIALITEECGALAGTGAGESTWTGVWTGYGTAVSVLYLWTLTLVLVRMFFPLEADLDFFGDLDLEAFFGDLDLEAFFGDLDLDADLDLEAFFGDFDFDAFFVFFAGFGD
jgi:hypothetical protein